MLDAWAERTYFDHHRTDQPAVTLRYPLADVLMLQPAEMEFLEKTLLRDLLDQGIVPKSRRADLRSHLNYALREWSLNKRADRGPKVLHLFAHRSGKHTFICLDRVLGELLVTVWQVQMGK